MELRLKKDFFICKKGSRVYPSDFTSRGSITWYNVIDPGGNRIKLGNSATMNVDEWIEEVEPMEPEYRLAKELPYAEPGAKIKIRETFIVVETRGKEQRVIGQREELGPLEAKGWIEKVKPTQSLPENEWGEKQEVVYSLKQLGFLTGNAIKEEILPAKVTYLLMLLRKDYHSLSYNTKKWLVGLFDFKPPIEEEKLFPEKNKRDR